MHNLLSSHIFLNKSYITHVTSHEKTSINGRRRVLRRRPPQREVLPPDVLLAISSILPSDDPLDKPDFDLVEYINKLSLTNSRSPISTRS